MSGGSLSAPTVNLNAGGAFSQSGGTFDFATFNHNDGSASFAALSLGGDAGSSNTYNLNGGSLTVWSQAMVGDAGTGTFIQNGGTHTDAYLWGSVTLTLGNQAGGSGSYTLNNGSLTADNLSVGKAGSGTFTQNGGTNTVTITLTLAQNYGSSGMYDLQGGSLAAATVNLNAGGSFTQTGGTFDFSTFNQSAGSASFAELFLGRNAGSDSTYNLSGGSLAALTEHVGYDGSGTFTQSGGSNTISDTLYVAYRNL